MLKQIKNYKWGFSTELSSMKYKRVDWSRKGRQVDWQNWKKAHARGFKKKKKSDKSTHGNNSQSNIRAYFRKKKKGGSGSGKNTKSSK